MKDKEVFDGLIKLAFHINTDFTLKSDERKYFAEVLTSAADKICDCLAMEDDGK